MCLYETLTCVHFYKSYCKLRFAINLCPNGNPCQKWTEDSRKTRNRRGQPKSVNPFLQWVNIRLKQGVLIDLKQILML